MEETYGCNLINTKRDERQLTEFVGRYHVHILVRQGQMTFSDGKNSFTSRQGDPFLRYFALSLFKLKRSTHFFKSSFEARFSSLPSFQLISG